MTAVPQNLVDLAHLAAPPAMRCVCGVTLRWTNAGLVDNLGDLVCRDGSPHSPRVASSPAAGWLR